MTVHRERLSDILDIKDGVLGVHGSLVLGCLTDKTLLVGERDEGRGGEASLLVGNCRSSIVNNPVPRNFCICGQSNRG
jgi:hypothetical protein